MTASIDGDSFVPFESSPFADLVGPIDMSVASLPDSMRFRAVVRPELRNTMGGAHGGFLAALIDIAAGQGTRRLLADGRTIVTKATTTEYLNPAREGEVVIAEIRVVEIQPSRVTTTCLLTVGDRRITSATVEFAVRGGSTGNGTTS